MSLDDDDTVEALFRETVMDNDGLGDGQNIQFPHSSGNERVRFEQ